MIASVIYFVPSIDRLKNQTKIEKCVSVIYVVHSFPEIHNFHIINTWSIVLFSDLLLCYQESGLLQWVSFGEHCFSLLCRWVCWKKVLFDSFKCDENSMQYDTILNRRVMNEINKNSCSQAMSNLAYS